MTKDKAVSNSIARYVRGGGSERTGRAVLREVTAALSTTNLATALAYHGFTTEAAAARTAAALHAQ